MYILVYILVYKGVVVRNLSIKCTLASKINSKATQVCGINLVKQAIYKTKNPIKFKGGKEITSFNII